MTQTKQPPINPERFIAAGAPDAGNPAAVPIETIRDWETQGLYQSPESATRARDFRIGKGLIQGGERRRFAMAVPLRADFDAVGVRCWARKSKDGPQARRLLALAAIYEGASRTEAARIGGVTLQIVRDWVLKFNADGPAGLIGWLRDSRRVSTTAPSHPCRDHRERPDPGCSWDRAVADRRSLPMDLRGIPRRHLPADPEPGIARHGLSQAFGSSAASRAGCRRD